MSAVAVTGAPTAAPPPIGQGQRLNATLVLSLLVHGIVILGLVLLWALRRLRKGSRPDLPGAPEP